MRENSITGRLISTRRCLRLGRLLECVVVGGILVWFGDCMICSYHVRVIQQSGGTVYFDWGTNRSGFPSKPWVPLPIRQAVGDVPFARPYAVSFQNCRVTVSAIRSVRQLRGVRSVFIGTADLEPGALSELAVIGQLEDLTLNNLRASKKELLELSTMKQVDWLSLSQIPECDDEVLAGFASVSGLRMLTLQYVPVTSEGLRRFELSQKVDLHHVALEAVPVDGRVLEMLDKLPRLRSLSISRTEMSDEEISVFYQRHPNITGRPNSPGDILLEFSKP